jgi:hypothetical protein
MNGEREAMKEECKTRHDAVQVDSGVKNEISIVKSIPR